MKLILSFFLAIIFLCGCRSSANEEEINLPAVTQTGENTAGCLIDGNIFVAQNGSPNIGSTFIPYGILFSPPFDFAFSNYEKTEIINLHFVSVNAPGEYLTTEENAKAIFFKDKNGDYYFSKVNSGQLTINKLENGIYSGTFAAVLYSETTNKIIQITNGRFDVNINTLNQ